MKTNKNKITVGGVIKAGIVGALIGLVVVLVQAAVAHAATVSTGAGLSVFPVCLSHPAEPGHAYQLDTDGNVPGAQVTNTGTQDEDLVLSTGPQQWNLPAMAVPPSWVSFSYPKMLLVIPQHHVSLAPGASAAIPVTVTIPANAARGTYVAGLIVSTSAGTGGVQLGAAAETMLVFTVGISKPDWTPKQLADAGDCWAVYPKLTPWQQAMGTAYKSPPPGWHETSTTWIYTPPPGWYYDRARSGVPVQVYRGGLPVIECANPAGYPAPGGGDEIGGQLPVTSTAAGCAKWLAESKAGTLPAEPVTGDSPQRGQTAADSSPAHPAYADVAAVAAIVIVPWTALHLYRRRRSRRA